MMCPGLLLNGEGFAEITGRILERGCMSLRTGARRAYFKLFINLLDLTNRKFLLILPRLIVFCRRVAQGESATLTR